MDYDILLDLVTDLGYSLAMSGAETFRVEESINRILASYGIASEVFAITNCMTVSIHTPDGKSVTRMKRIGFHGNDLDSVERYSNLSRRICTQKPDPNTAMQWLQETHNSRVKYKLPLYLLGNILGAAGFAVFFGGTLMDAFCAALCGLLVGLSDHFFGKFGTNQFFKTIVCAFIMTVVANITGVLGLADNSDAVIIGTLMILVPGLLFTNAMRDIIFGDTNSGINRIVQVLLIAAAIALGTGAAWNLANVLGEIMVNSPIQTYSWLIQCVAAFLGSIGFSVIFNIHGPGILLCALGGAVSWAVYCLAAYCGSTEIMCYFLSALTAAVYSEAMARIRKYPAISYLVISIFPLIPGSGIYYTTNCLVLGDMAGFTQLGKQTISIAGVIAVGILMVSTLVRLWNEWKKHRYAKKASV
ncbi:MAG: threonine/serine exporter family protein [Oscillospiraceae bacterium]|nr:threonine/serine exporter family protein [Oscillospiraceae bacterium]